MEHALNTQPVEGICTIDRKGRIDPGLVYGVASEFVACEREITFIVCLFVCLFLFYFFFSCILFPMRP